MEINYAFETVLFTNKCYVDAINRGAGAEEQEIALNACRVVFKKLVLDAGLAQEYNEYCIKKSLHKEVI